MKVSKLTIGRLFNLGSYEHVRYDITVELEVGDSPTDALVKLEKIVAALAPERASGVKTTGELDHEKFHLDEQVKRLRKEGPEEFRRRHGHFVGTPAEYLKRCEKSYREEVKKRAEYERKALLARVLLSDLGGAVKWKDAKLDWENDDE